MVLPLIINLYLLPISKIFVDETKPSNVPPAVVKVSASTITPPALLTKSATKFTGCDKISAPLVGLVWS